METPTLTAKEHFFDRWAPSYDWLLPSVFYQAVHQRLLDYVDLGEEAVVLDMGCGTGRLLHRLGDRFPTLRGYGLDLSAEMVRQARRGDRHRPRFIFMQGRSDRLSFADGQLDAVFSTISFLHYPDPLRVLQEVQRVLRPQGRFYLADYVPACSSARRMAITPGGLRFYPQQERELLGQQAALICLGHHYLLGPVLLTVWGKEHDPAS